MPEPSPGQAAMPAQGELMDLIEHIFLPPDAGKRDDNAYDTSEFRAEMVASLHRSLGAFEMLVTGPAAAATSRCKRMISRLQNAKPGAGQLHTQAIQDLLSDLPHNDTIALELCEQNAALLITKTGENFVVEPFELLAPNATVMRCQVSLVRQFPASAIIIPGHIGTDACFLATFADLLAQLDRYSLPEFAAKASKSGEEHIEERDTTDPALVTEMLRSWLHGYGSQSASNMRIQKRSREHVRYEGGNRVAWHRSSLWLFLRVAMRIILDRADQVAAPTISTYKSFMIFFMSSILNRAVSAGLSSEHLHGISAKISRRVHKLALQDEPAWLAAVNKSVAAATKCLQKRWKQEQTRDSRVLDLSSLKTTNFETSTHFDMAELKDHATWLKTREAKPIACSDIAQRQDFPRHPSNTIPGVQIFKNIWHLIEFEAWVAEHLGTWTELQCQEHIRLSLVGLATQVSLLIETYHSAASQIYSKNPENLSRAYLVVLELWVTCDKLVATHFPIIKQYHPGIVSDNFGKLLLPKSKEMERLRTIELYLHRRITQAQYPESPCSKVLDSSQSFACRVFDASPPMQDLLQHAQKIQEDSRRQKQEEFVRLSTKYDILITEASRLSHVEMEYKREGYWQRQCRANCSKCSKSYTAMEMRIEIWEDILPSGINFCKGMIAELNMDSAVQAWRNATLLLTLEIFVQTIPEPTAPQVYWLSEISRLPPGTGTSQCRFQLASTTKPFVKAHYRTMKVSDATYDNVCKPHGSRYLYLDRRLGISIEAGIARPVIPLPCSLAALSSLPSRGGVCLPDFIRGTSHTSNEVLASQHACPEDMSLEEFRAFGLLRSDLRLQWPNILTELTSPCLSQRSPETCLLLTQAAFEAGPCFPIATSSNESRTTRLRVTHSILHDERFAASVVDGLQQTLKAASETWESSNTCFMILCLAQRVLTTSSTDRIHRACLEVLSEMRSTAFRWASMLFEQADESESESERRNLASLALFFALICHNTFDVGLDNLATIFRDCDTAKLLIITSVFAEQYKDLSASTENILMKILRQRQQRLAHALEGFLTQEILDRQNDCLDAATTYFWPAFVPGQSWVSAFPKSGSRHVLQTMSAAGSGREAVAVSFNLLTGLILVNGLPISVLPDQYQSHNTFKILFQEYIPRVVTSNVPGMHFSGSKTHHSWDIHLALYGTSLTIRTLRDNQRYEFIPATMLGSEVPSEFKHNFHHWLDLDRNTIEFRTLSSRWEPAAANWTLDLQTGRLVKGGQFLLSATSQTAKTISTSLQALESPTYMSFVLCGGTVKAHLPRLQLSFSLQASSDRLLSDNYTGFVLDSNQSIGTLFGLANRLVLCSEGSELRLRERIVLIPRGNVHFSTTASGMAVGISSQDLTTISNKIVPLKQGSIKYSTFAIDKHLRKLRDSGLLGDRLLLAYLHAVTSSCLPDTLTERTGTEEALRLLNSAAVKSHPVIDGESKQLLHQLAELSPERSYYPEHMKSMETISWDRRLPILSQHDYFGRYVASIEDHADINGMLGFHSSRTRYPQKSSRALVQRALTRNSFLRTRGFGAEESQESRDEVYTGRAAASGQKCQRSAGISRIVINGETELVEKVSSFSVSEVQQVTGDVILGIVADTSRPTPSLQLHAPFDKFISGQWCRLHEHLSTRIDFPRERHALSAMLAFYAFTSKTDEDWKAVQALAAFITAPELSTRLITPGSVPEFDLSDRMSIHSDVCDIAKQQLLPLERTPDGKLERRAGETYYDFDNRQAWNYRDNSSSAIWRLAQILGSQFDQTKCRSPSLDQKANYWNYIDLWSFSREIAASFELAWRQHHFSLYMDKIARVMGRLPAASPIDLEHAAPSAILHHGAPSSHRGYIVMDDLLTHTPPSFMAPTFDSMSKLSDASAAVNFSPALTETDAMENLLEDLETHKSGKHEDSYIKELQASASAKIATQEPSESQQSILQLRPTLQVHLDETTSYLVACETAVRQALEETHAHTRTSSLGGHLPRISVLLLLQQLSKDRWPRVSPSWRQCLVQYALAMTAVQRAHRMLAASTWLDLKKEFDNPGHSNWDPMHHPETLLLEVESSLLVRSVQEDISNTMRNPPGNINSVMQLNMGEGKSSVIVPMTAVALADKTRLVRIVVAKPQSNQMRHMLISKLGDLLNRRVFYLPFSRDLQPDISLVKNIQDMLELCMSEGGMLLLQPENILSFKLMGIENTNSGHGALGQALLSTQRWLEQCARDIVDESDENFNCKFELVYTMGNQQSVDLGLQRWSIIQRILGLVWEVSLEVHRSDPDGCHIEPSESSTIPVVRIVGDAAGKRLVRKVAKRICETGLDGFPIHRQPPSLRQKLITYMIEQDVPSDIVEAVEDPSNKFFCDVTKGPLWLLRGLLAGGVILFSLREKRWKVNYGRTWTREPPTPLAVPYHAKDQPSPRSEFSHPDIIIFLTCLTYYYRGLTNDELDLSFECLDRKDQVEFDLWVKDAQGFDSNFKQLSAINLKDRKQCLEKVYPKLRYSKAAIDFYLSRIVFAKYMREFPKKLSASGWDLARSVPHPVTGFSGTCDAKYLLPLTIQHLDLPDQLHTNASVLRCLLHPENHVREMKGGPESHTFFDTLIESIAGAESDSIQVILDVGAQVLEYSNVQAAKKWLEATPDGSHEAVIFVNDSDELTVLTRNGMTESFLSSPYSHQMAKCLVFLDEAHTRGIDLKLPESYRAAVTLGPRLSKDRLVQACMRMRKLGVGQSVTFFIQPEIQQRIRQLRAYSPERRLTTPDVLIWSISETWTELRKNISLWATQGIRHQRQEPIWQHCLNQLGNEAGGRLEQQIEKYLDDEAQTLEQRYRPQQALPQDHLLEVEELNDPDFATRRAELEAIRQKCRDHGIRSFDSATLQEEQERELSPELETEKQVERPPPAKAETHALSTVVRSFVNTGRLVQASDNRDVLPAFAAFKHTTAAKLFDVGDFPCNVLVTGDFVRTVIPCVNHVSDMFQRPVRWVVRSRADAGLMVIMSSFEVNELYDVLRLSKTVITHQYSPRMNLAFPNLDHLKLYTMPETPREWIVPSHLAAQLDIFSGQSWFKSYAQYVEVCKYLGLSCRANEGEETVAADGFEGKTAENSDCEFAKSPVAFLKAIYNGVRNDSQDVSRTDMGRMLGGELLRPEDFEDR